MMTGKSLVKQDRGIVVITGASSGIGRACAHLLSRSGYRVLGGVRTAMAGEVLRRESSGRCIPVILDVTDRDQVVNAVEAVKNVDGFQRGLRGLINNAGIVSAGPLEFFPLPAFRQALEVNVIGQIAVTQAFLPLIRQGRGRIINIGSPSGFFAPPFLGPYAATKFAMEAFTDALRREVRSWGIEVSLVEPGAVETPIWDKSLEGANRMEAELPARGKALYEESFSLSRAMIKALRRQALSPDAVARTVRCALTSHRPRTRYLVGTDARLQAMAARFVPDRLMDWVVARAMARSNPIFP
jgi:NAD(P)-dependent dehydrogenase (short-subunit alcohol dehydrogenase family)